MACFGVLIELVITI